MIWRNFLPQPPWEGPPVPKWCSIGWPVIPKGETSNPGEEVRNEVVEEPNITKFRSMAPGMQDQVLSYAYGWHDGVKKLLGAKLKSRYRVKEE